MATGGQGPVRGAQPRHGAWRGEQSRKESCMKSKKNLWIAGLAALLLGVPLAEKAAAEDTGDIVYLSISLIWEIIDAAASSS